MDEFLKEGNYITYNGVYNIFSETSTDTPLLLGSVNNLEELDLFIKGYMVCLYKYKSITKDLIHKNHVLDEVNKVNIERYEKIITDSAEANLAFP